MNAVESDECAYGQQARSSRSELFYQKGVVKNFAKFTEKHLCQSLFVNKVAGISPANLVKKSLDQVLSCEFCEIF